MSNSIIRFSPSPQTLTDLGRPEKLIYCTARPGDEVPPALLPLLRLTFWADERAPQEYLPGPMVVLAAMLLLQPEHPTMSHAALRRLARRHVAEVMYRDASPIEANLTNVQRRHRHG